jgi:phosphatidate cytidylyltransferase
MSGIKNKINKAMITKTITAIVLIAVVLPILIAGGIWIRILTAVVAALSAYEIANIQSEKAKWLSTLINLAAMLGMISCKGSVFPMIAAFYATILFLSVLVDKNTTAEFAAYSFMLAQVVSIGLRGIQHFYTFDDGFLIMIFVTLTCYACDTGAYFCGVFFGKHKMIPRVSPNKTWEGSIGGYVTGAVIGLLFGFLFTKQLPSSLIVTASLTLPLLAQLGDLSFSSVKRHFGVKDFGSFLPGHGGILDRIDSLVFCLMFFEALLLLWGL